MNQLDWTGLYINCVYCGHRYGPEKDTPAVMADVLKEHIEQCPEHPLSQRRDEVIAILENIPESARVRVREGGGPEDVYLSLAVSVAKLDKRNQELEHSFASHTEAIETAPEGLVKELCDALTERAIWSHVTSKHENRWHGCSYAVCCDMKVLICRAMAFIGTGECCTCCGGNGHGEFGEEPITGTCPKCQGSGQNPPIDL